MADDLNQTHWRPSDYRDTVVALLVAAMAGDTKANSLKALRLILWAADYFDVTQIPQKFGANIIEALVALVAPLTDAVGNCIAREQVLIGMQAAGCLADVYGRPVSAQPDALVQDWLDHLAILIKEIEIAGIRQRIIERGGAFRSVMEVGETAQHTLQ